jgi:hypothetical protein
MWYLSLYTRTKNSCVLLNYYEYDTLSDAKYALSRATPEYDADFYHIEDILGGLDTTVSKQFVCRGDFAHNKTKAEMQRQAELKAIKLLKLMPKLREAQDKQSLAEQIATEMQMLKSALTKAQYDVLLTELEKQPYIRKLQYIA